MVKKIKKLVSSYEYLDLGFPIILKDIAIILHPELFIDHELTYYRKIY